MKVRGDFEQYVKQHVNAKIIQTWWRMVFFRKKRVRAVLCIQNYFRQTKCGKGFLKLNKSRASKLHSDEELSFRDYHFVICGTLPLIDGEKYSQATFKDVITSHHGRVCAKLPDSNNKLSTKRYTVLASDKACGMKSIPSQIKSALRNGHKILKFNFVPDSIRDRKLKNELLYKLDFTKHLKKTSKHV